MFHYDTNNQAPLRFILNLILSLSLILILSLSLILILSLSLNAAGV